MEVSVLDPLIGNREPKTLGGITLRESREVFAKELIPRVGIILASSY